MRKRVCSIALALALAVTMALPVFAAESEADREPPVSSGADSGAGPVEFRAELREDGIYCMFSRIPEGADYIAIQCSMGGITYSECWDSLTWEEPIIPSDDPWEKLCIGNDVHALDAFRRGAVNKLFVKGIIEIVPDDCECDPDDFCWCECEYVETEPVVFSNDLQIPLPDSPPPFTTGIGYSEYSGYMVVGSFPDMPANTAQILTMCSLNGTDYEQVGYAWFLDALGTQDEQEKYDLENQWCILKNDEPLKSYLKNQLDRFYIRLQITTDDGETYDTEAAQINRGTLQPVPESWSVFATFPGTMYDPFDMDPQFPRDGQYQITVSEDAAAEEVEALLPEKLPVKVSFLKKETGEFATAGIVECDVRWKELPSLQLTAGETLILPDMIDWLEVPAGSTVVTPHGRYTLSESLSVGSIQTTGQVRLLFSVIGADEPPDLFLSDETLMCDGSLALAFRRKPSGATSIRTFLSVPGEEGRREIGDLFDLRGLNHNQWAEIYGYVPLLPLDDPAFEQIGEENPLYIDMEVEGGTFDGARLRLAWPGDYGDDPPQEIPEDDSEGNRGDAGSDNSSGDSSDEGGQRPDLPDESAESEISPPEKESPAVTEASLPEKESSAVTEASPPEKESPAVTETSPLPDKETSFAADQTPPEKVTAPAAEETSPAEQRGRSAAEPSPSPKNPSSAELPVSAASKAPGRNSSFFVPVSVAIAAVLLGGGIIAAAAPRNGASGREGVFRKMRRILKKWLR